MLKRLFLRAIAYYRRTGGGVHWFGIECNFEPTCSEYAQTAIRRFGLYRGLALTWNRLQRCRKPDCICKCIEPVPEEQTDAEAG